jgi:hypothetical protein
MNSKKSPGSGLFLVGAERYLDALTAIAAFRGEVQEMCTEIYEHYAPELAEQMGLDQEDCEPFDEHNPDKPSAEVGITRPAQKGCTFCLSLLWGENKRVDDILTAAVSQGFYHRRLRDDIHAGFRQKNPHCRVEIFDTYTLVLYQGLKDLASAKRRTGRTGRRVVRLLQVNRRTETKRPQNSVKSATWPGDTLF